MENYTQFVTSGSDLHGLEEFGWVARFLQGNDHQATFHVYEYRGEAPSEVFEQIEGEPVKDRYLRRKEWEARVRLFQTPGRADYIDFVIGEQTRLFDSDVSLTIKEYRPAEGSLPTPSSVLVEVAFT